MRKPTKTISGVAPLAVMLPPRKCEHGVCLYCPSLNAPQSYTPESPAVLRARALDYDPVKQIKARIKMFKDMNHPVDKIELIIMGGTFLSFSKEFQYDFVKKCYDALNGVKSENLDEAKRKNETAKNRCVALCIETRPDVCSDELVNRILEFGATRVELGVQAVDDEIYGKINRGHKVEDVISATKRLKKAGFKVGYHLMPGLPGSNMKKDLKMFKKVFSSSKFKPDQIKIYPCQVLKGAGLEKLYYNGEYAPYEREQLIELIINLYRYTPVYCRIMRIMREIPPYYLVCGVKNIDLRKDIEEEIKKRRLDKKIKEIRFREIGFYLRDNPKSKLNLDIKIKKKTYKASGGKEIFLEAVNKDNVLFGLLRLRFEKSKDKKEREIAMIRELHVYSSALKLGSFGEEFKKSFQHKGLGKLLLKKAEEIALKAGKKKIKIISGVGVREYYQKLGYSLDGEGVYMGKGIV